MLSQNENFVFAVWMCVKKFLSGVEECTGASADTIEKVLQTEKHMIYMY